MLFALGFSCLFVRRFRHMFWKMASKDSEILAICSDLHPYFRAF